MAVTLGPRTPTGKKRYLGLLLPPLAVAVALIGVLYVSRGSDSRQELDNDLCAIDRDESDPQAVFLLDFRKPLDRAHLSLPGELIRNASLHLGAHTELRVFTLARDDQAPRSSIDRICKPYDNADLQIGTAKDQRDDLRDCDDLPAQLPGSLREAADRFCARRQWLQRRVDALARNQPLEPVANSYLVEALEDIVIDLSKGSGPRMIYVFSDMMQHAGWYSHLDLEWHEWSFEQYEAIRSALAPRMGQRPPVSDLTVQVYYVPRLDLTEHPRPKRAHQEFWKRYFASARLTFREQPPLPAYAAESLMDRSTPEELAERERERIEQERQETARLLAEVRQQQAELAKEWERVEEERARITAAPKAQPQRERAAELRRQQQSLADQREELEARQEIGEIAAEAESSPQVAEEQTVPAILAKNAGASGGRIAPETREENAVAVPEIDDEDQVADEQTAEGVGQGTAVAIEGNVPEFVEPADSVSGDSSEAIGQLALATDQSPATTLPPCDVSLLPKYLTEAATDIYPKQRGMNLNYGSATIAVRYVLDEEGATINDEIVVMSEESSVERPRAFGLFARIAREVVRSWVFQFDGDQREGSCSRRQERTTTFQFQYD